MHACFRYLFVFLCTALMGGLALAADKADTPATGTVTGQFKKADKKPLSNGRLYVYDKSQGPPSADTYVRVPDHVLSLDKDGKFQLELPPGSYYFSAVKMPEIGRMGPPADGEPIYFRKDAKGNISEIVVRAGKKANAGIVSTSFPYKRFKETAAKEIAVVEGVVTDANGSPVEGAVVLAYLNPGVEDKAFQVSERTGKNGKFALRFTDGGTFYLRVRGEYGGGAPKEGEVVNINDPKEVVAAAVKKGETVTGVILQTTRLQQRGPMYKVKK